MKYFVRAGALAGFIELVTSQGYDPIYLLNQSNILPSQLNDPDTLLPYEYLAEVLELGANYTGRADFGTQLSLNQGLSTVGLLGAYMAQQHNIELSLNCAKKFAHMHAQGVLLEVNAINPTQCKLTIDMAVNSQEQYPQLVQLSIGLVYGLIGEMMGEHWTADLITFKQVQSPNLHKNFSQLLGCEVQFGALTDSIVFKSVVLKKKPLLPNNLINDIINKQFMQVQSNKPDTVALVRHAINMLLPTGDCSKNNIALSLGIHPKKLERLLAEINLSYRDVLESTRKAIAIRTLESDHMELTNLALNLGYSEFSAFSRSFKKWFGFSPKNYQVQKKKQRDESAREL